MAERAGNSGNSRGSSHKRAPRGGQPQKPRAAGNTKPLRRERRLALPRVANALAKAAAERARIEALIEKAHPELANTVGVVIQRAMANGKTEAVTVQRPVPLVDLTNRTEGDKGWSLGQARVLFGDGYHLRRVVELTGWGGWWFSDLVDAEGYARSFRAEAWAA